MAKEIEAILELLKYKNKDFGEILLQGNLNWMNILGFLSYHRVAGLAYEKIKEIGVRSFDYPLYLTTSMINEAQRIRTLEQNYWINKISKAFKEANIQHAFLKGAILNNTIYEYGSRVSNDIDVLINKDSINESTTILKSIGFIQGKYNYKTKEIIEFTEDEILTSLNTRGETAPFVLKTKNKFAETIDVDLNFSIDWCPNNTKIVKEFLDDRILISKKDRNDIYSLNLYYNFLELCSHFYKDTALIDILRKRKIIDLYKIVDIYYFVQKHFKQLNIDYLLQQIKKFNLSKCVYFTLYYVTSSFPDCKSNIIKKIMKETKQGNNINDIFSQYDNYKMSTNTSIKNRLASYDVIKKFKE